MRSLLFDELISVSAGTDNTAMHSVLVAVDGAFSIRVTDGSTAGFKTVNVGLSYSGTEGLVDITVIQ